MRAPIFAFALGFALSIAGGVLAQSTGFPSRPRFQSVGVGQPAPTANGRILATTIQAGSASASGHSISSYINSATDVPLYVRQDGAANIATFAGAGGVAVANIASNGYATVTGQVNFRDGVGGYMEFVNRNVAARGFKWYTGANGTANTLTLETNGDLVVNGFPAVTGRMTACSAGGATGAVSNNRANCASGSRGGAGSYLITLSTSYSATPICTGNIIGGQVGFVTISVTNVGSVGVDTRNTAGALTDLNFNLSCWGQ